MKGFLDRFEDHQLAVVLIEEMNEELIIPIHQLPKGSKENTWFHMKEVNGSFEIIGIDYKKTKEEAKTSKDLIAQLRAKSRGSKFKKK